MFNQFPRSIKVLVLSTIIALERFAYYGVRGIAVFYAMEELNMANSGQGTFFTYYSLLTILAGLLCLPAGAISDLLLKHRLGFSVGAALCILGYLIMIIPGSIPFLLGAIIALLGTSLTRVNVYALVGFLFDPADSKRISAFTISYGAVNLGAATSAVILVAIGERFGFGWGCGIAAMTMLLALLLFLLCYNQFGNELPPSGLAIQPRPSGHKNSQWSVLYILLLSAFAIFFWQVYEQLNYASDPLWSTGERITFFGQTIDRSTIQYLNPLILIPASILMAWIAYTIKIHRRKLLVGVAGAGFVVLAAISYAVFDMGLSTNTMVVFWILMMVAMGVIEAIISPVLLAEISILGTRKFAALAIGFYFMVLSVIPAMIRFLGEAVDLPMNSWFWSFWVVLLLLSVTLILIRNRRKAQHKTAALDSDVF